MTNAMSGYGQLWRRAGLACFAGCLLTAGAAGAVQAQQSPPAVAIKAGIVRVSGNLYAAKNPKFVPTFPTLLYVTKAGIILVDPISIEQATWLKGEIKKTFDLPVKYVIYSHSHFDLVDGASVFKDTAQVVAHQGVVETLAIARAGLPVNRAYTDTNGDGRISKEESVGALRERWDDVDKTHRGWVTGKDIEADVVDPDITYSCKMSISLGGLTVELVHPGENHSFDATVVKFDAERVIYAADFLNAKLWPAGGYAGAPMKDWIQSVRNVAQMDFDGFYPSHGFAGSGPDGGMFTKQDVVDYANFYDDLTKIVQSGIDKGESLKQIQDENKLEKYRGWRRYSDDFVRTNLADVYDNLTEWKGSKLFHDKYVPLLNKLMADSPKCY